jgi:Amidohydrolase family
VGIPQQLSRFLRSSTLLAVVAMALCTVTRAQGEITSLPAQSSSTLKLVVLRASRMLDVLRGETVAPAVVAIKDNLIVSVTREFPSKAGEVIDLGDVTLLPGLIDVHTHLVLNTDDGWEQMIVRDTPADAAIRGVPNARKTLLAGFTTVRDLGNWGGFPDVALMRAIERGLIDGPRVIPDLGSSKGRLYYCPTGSSTLRMSKTILAV